MEIKISALIETFDEPHHDAVFCAGYSPQEKRVRVSEIPCAQLTKQRRLQWAVARSLCGDSPELYHPKFVMALLSSNVLPARNTTDTHFLEWKFPAIAFDTNEATRRSMTLNGMRMNTEYFAFGSPRILQFVEERLKEGQADVVHDVMVYLTQRVLQLHASSKEEVLLQAESLAAYLGIDAERVCKLLHPTLEGECKNDEIIQQIENGFAGAPRRAVNIRAVVENQLQRFEPEMQEFDQQRSRVLELLDKVVFRFCR